MGRIALEDIDKYGSGSNGGSYFSLKNDKEISQVRFMLDQASDLGDYIFAVHEIMVGEKKRYVSCLRDYNQPVDDCPFCAERKKVIPKIFLPLYNVDADEVQIWERGKTYVSKLTSVFSRYEKKGPIVNNIFEIERNGKPNDTKTTYEIYQIDSDETTIDDLGEVPQILGRYVMDKSADDMNYYLDEGEFPPTDDSDGDDTPIRRRGRAEKEDDNSPEDEKPARNRSRQAESGSGRSERRTPATTRKNRF